MTEKTKGEVEQASEESRTSGLGGLLTEKISRRSFGKLLGAQTVLALTVSLSGCLGGGGGGSHDEETPPVEAKTLTRAEFVATVSDYFDWTHSSQYLDQFKALQPTFSDVTLGVTPYGKQIETALEAGLLDNSQGYFYPDQPITREDAADIYVKAFRIPAATTNPLTGFSDASSISSDRLASVKAIVAAGFMGGTSTTAFSPQGTVSADDAKAILAKVTSTLVAPVQAMPKPGTTSPRRYVSYTTPTPGAKIYITETFDGSEPEDPTTSSKAIAYDFVTIGTRAYVVDDGRAGTLKVTQPGGTIRVKAVAKKDGLATSNVQSFTWYLNRPGSNIKEPAEKQTQPFEYKVVHQGTSTSPTVYKIYNMSESVQAFSYLIMGPTRGIVFDFLQVHYLSGNMKTLVDRLANGVPYDAVLGHNHVDHVAQIGNFTSVATDGSGGVASWGGKIYTTKLDKYQLMAVSASTNAGYKAAGDEAVELEDGHVFDLGGGIAVTAWHAPAHEDGLVTLVTSNGWVYASDMFGCNRPYTADTTNYAGMRSDLFLAMTRQLVSNYKKCIAGGQILEVTNAHNEAPLTGQGIDVFIKCFQKMVDDGPSATEGSIRGGVNRMSMVREGESNVKGMWRGRNWMAVEIGGNPSAHKDFTTFTEGSSSVMTGTGLAYPCNNTVDYNTADGYKKYSVLANLEITGGELIGVDVYWNTNQSAGSVPRKLANKLDPWTYSYQIYVPAGTGSITVVPWAMSSNFKSMTLNGTAVKQGAGTTVAATAGSKITVVIVSPDGSQTGTYTFTVTNTKS
ncbi:S-layer homology domain-containing protein [Propionivibrio sp.]|uniref:S-layer homology domain-containing protein n=1 Tax=Propionivibrio sp. TaxID=2212460 RepID=UPI0039E271CE